MKNLLDQMSEANAEISEGKYGAYLREFRRFTAAAHADGALLRKQKELIAVGIALSKRCERCIAYHVKAALANGATADELIEAAFVAVIMDGGPALSHIGLVLDAVREFGGESHAS